MTTVQQVDRPLLGVILMLGFCTLAPMGDAIAKLLGDTIPLLQLLTIRFAVQALVLSIFAVFADISLKMNAYQLKFTALRTLLHIIGVGAMFLSLRYLPLADAVAIAFVMPFIMLLLGKYVLNEEVGRHRLIACLIGFIGTLLVIQPSFAEVGYPALLPLIVAVDFALFMLVTRKIAKEVDPIALQTVSGVMATVLFLIVYAGLGLSIAGDLPFIQPTSIDMTLLLVVGLLGTVAHLLMTWSLRFAPSATLAPMQYLEIPVATLVGYWIFADLPNGMAAVGICITICSGLYIVYREHKTSASTP